MRKSIVLAAVNARYAHASLGLRSLRANLGALRECSRIVEFDLQSDPANAAAELLAGEPEILAIGIYVWNVHRVRRILHEVRRRAPRVRIVTGGPECIEGRRPDGPAPADAVLSGEAETLFAETCAELAAGRPARDRPPGGDPPDLSRLVLPDAEYSDRDLSTRIVYAETARGCPYGCEYCLSARDRRVRYFPEARVFASLDRLLARGARRVKFVDRAFNADAGRAARLLDFWLGRCRPGLTVQLEAVPERFPDGLRDRLRRFPPGSLRLEIGVQTFDPRVADRVGRRMDPARVEEALGFLRRETSVAVHADLIAGLPGETPAGFGAGFDRLAALDPAEIQINLLKRLPGARIGRHDEAFGMRYSPEPPYEFLSHDGWSEEEAKRIRRFARFWDRAWNRGRLRGETKRLWAGGGSPFEAFLAFSDHAAERFGRDWGIPMERLRGALREFGARRPGRPRDSLDLRANGVQIEGLPFRMRTGKERE